MQTLSRCSGYATAFDVRDLEQQVRTLGRALAGWASPRWRMLTGMAAMASVMPTLQLGGDEAELIELVFVVIFVVLSFSLHEAAHAWMAWKCGDPTAKDLGRITFNPIPSIDPLFSIVMPAAAMLLNLPLIGGAKPVPVSYHRLRHPARDMMLVALAGPATNFLLAIVFMLGLKFSLTYLDFSPESILGQVFVSALRWNVSLAAFNLLPIPPLDGSRVVAWLLPESLRSSFQSLERFGLLLVLFAVQVPAVMYLYRQGVREMYSLIAFIVGGL